MSSVWERKVEKIIATWWKLFFPSHPTNELYILRPDPVEVPRLDSFFLVFYLLLTPVPPQERHHGETGSHIS